MLKNNKKDIELMTMNSQKVQPFDMFFNTCCHHFNNFLTLSSSVTFFVFVVSILINPSECGTLISKTKNNLGEDGMVTRTQLELTCFSCTATRVNNTCTEKFRKNVTRNGMDNRCRIYERNGVVVSQGIVPSMLCSSEAKHRVMGRIPHNLIGEGPVFVGCCNSDKCNTDYCSAIRHNSTICNTTIGWKRPKPQDKSKPRSSIINTKINVKQQDRRTKEATTPSPSANKKDILQNDDPNRQAVSLSSKLKNDDTKRKSAPLTKTNETDSADKTDPKADELKPEPEGSFATSLQMPSLIYFSTLIYLYSCGNKLMFKQ